MKSQKLKSVLNPKKTKNSIGSRKVQPVNKLVEVFAQKTNETTTLNGAITLKSTFSGLVDFFALGGAIRGRTEADKIKLFNAAFKEDRLLATKLLFHTRNIRGGLGERETFRVILKNLAQNSPSTVVQNLVNIPKFGRFDDLYVLFGTSVEQDVLGFIKNQLQEDLSNFDNDKSISLLAKWLPSENTSSLVTRQRATKIREYLGLSSKQYRKILSALRGYLHVVEKQMCSNDWGNINYEQVPSKAGINYREAFQKHDSERYAKYIAGVEKGEKKINAGALFPYEIVEKALSGYSKTLDAAWNNLPDYLEGNARNILCVCDVSGSMAGRPLNVSISLGIYTAERNNGAFKDYFITFTSEPTLQKVSGSTIQEKVKSISGPVGYDTNFQRVFENLLAFAKANKVPAQDMPEQIIAISDMEFNIPGTTTGLTNHEAIKTQYKKAGYAMPNLVYWNVNSHQDNVPVDKNEQGVILVSGASPSVFKTLLSGKRVTPVDQVLETLNQECYNCIT